MRNHDVAPRLGRVALGVGIGMTDPCPCRFGLRLHRLVFEFLAEGDDDRLLINAQDRGMRVFRPRWQVLDCGALLPLGDGLRIDAEALGQNPQALSLCCIARRTTSVVRALPRKICPIAQPSTLVRMMHHQIP